MCQYPETAWSRLAALTPCSEQLFVRSDGELRGEQPHLFLAVVAARWRERVAGIVPHVPIPQPVVGDPEGGGLVVALPQLRQ